MSNRTGPGLILSSIALAITSSLCCILPILAIVGGISGAAGNLSWVEPLRPYLIALTIIILGFAFYNAYRPEAKDECGCAPGKKPFLQSKGFLWTITLVSALLMSFPYYSHFFVKSNTPAIATQPGSDVKLASFSVEGMTCETCEEHVNSVLLKQKGVVTSKTNYKEGITVVTYNHSQTSLSFLMDVVQKETGYKTSNE